MLIIPAIGMDKDNIIKSFVFLERQIINPNYLLSFKND